MQDLVLKVAIIRLSSLGDIISTLVFLDFIKARFVALKRKIEISFIIDSQFREILENSPLIDKIIDLPLRQSKKNKKLIFSAIKKVRQLGRKTHFDIVIDAQGLLKSALIGKFLKKSAFVGYDKDSVREKIASFFYSKRVRIAYNEHILKRQYELFKCAFGDLDLAQDFDLQMLDSRNLALDSSKNAKEKIANILAQDSQDSRYSQDFSPKNALDSRDSRAKSAPKILFLVETSKTEKEFLLESFGTLAQNLWSEFECAKIFLIWDKKETEIRALGAKDSRFFVLPRLNLDEIKALLARMNLVIGGDTGITHTAWALKIPTITLYISTNMARFALGGEKHISLLVDSTQKSIDIICKSAKVLLK